MMGMLNNVAGVIAMSGTHIYSWYHLENEKINYKNKRLYITFILSVVMLLMSAYFVDKSIKIICMTILCIFLNYFLLRKSVKKSILMAIITQLEFMIAEMLLMLIFSFFNVDITSFVKSVYGGAAIDTSVSIIVILISLTNLDSKIYQFILKITNKISYKYFMAFVFFGILVTDILTVSIYYKLDFQYLLLFNTSISIIYFLIVLHALYNKNNYLKVSDKYNMKIF